MHAPLLNHVKQIPYYSVALIVTDDILSLNFPRVYNTVRLQLPSYQ